VAVAMIILLIGVVRRASKRNQKLTWASAVVLGSWLLAITTVLIGDVPSRILYWFDANHATLAERYHFAKTPLLSWFENANVGGNPGYQIVADIIANSAQGIFFVVICAAAYFWGERHRKEGKFKS
jgi:hypothetical protein